jgi:two-component system, sporulation sensor kinase E
MRSDPLAAINSVALAIGTFDSINEMLEYALTKVLEVVEAEAAGVYLLDEDRQRLTFAAHRGLSAEASHDFDDLPLGEGLSGRVALDGVPMVVRHLKDHPRLTRMAARAEGFCAFASVPLRSSYKTYGTLNIYSREERDFTEEDVQLLTSMASQIGLAVGNTRLYLRLQASERKFRALVESAKDLIYLIDLEGHIAYINPAAASRLGYEPQELCGRSRSLLSLVHPDDRHRVADALPRTLKGEPLPPFEFRMMHRDGSVRWFAHTMIPFRDESGAVVGVHGIAYDRTKRRELESQMARAERLADLGRMAATIAHEIRNPLGAIVNSVNVLRHPAGASDPRLLQIVTEEADRLDTIIRDFLLFARPPARSPVPCQLLEVVESTAVLFRRAATLAPGVELVVTGDPALPLVTADPSEIRQVVWNLLANAADVTPAGGRIDLHITADQASGSLRIEILDDGPGVADTEAVFEPFYTTKAQGTGLGLAVTARVVRDHGGTVRVVNMPPRGACFTITLPLAPVAASKGAA